MAAKKIKEPVINLRLETRPEAIQLASHDCIVYSVQKTINEQGQLVYAPQLFFHTRKHYTDEQKQAFYQVATAQLVSLAQIMLSRNKNLDKANDSGYLYTVDTADNEEYKITAHCFIMDITAGKAYNVGLLKEPHCVSALLQVLFANIPNQPKAGFIPALNKMNSTGASSPYQIERILSNCMNNMAIIEVSSAQEMEALDANGFRCMQYPPEIADTFHFYSLDEYYMMHPIMHPEKQMWDIIYPAQAILELYKDAEDIDCIGFHGFTELHNLGETTTEQKMEMDS